MENEEKEQKEWVKAYKSCSLSLQKECDLLRTYRRSKGHVKAEDLEILRQGWLDSHNQHNDNLQRWWPTILDSHLSAEKEGYREHSHRCPTCKNVFYSTHRATVYCNYWCRYTTNKRQRIERYLKTLERKCPGCSKDFTAKKKAMLFCSDACRQKVYRYRKKGLGVTGAR